MSRPCWLVAAAAAAVEEVAAAFPAAAGVFPAEEAVAFPGVAMAAMADFRGVAMAAVVIRAAVEVQRSDLVAALVAGAALAEVTIPGAQEAAAASFLLLTFQVAIFPAREAQGPAADVFHRMARHVLQPVIFRPRAAELRSYHPGTNRVKEVELDPLKNL
jgi:hypothetical protein